MGLKHACAARRRGNARSAAQLQYAHIDSGVCACSDSRSAIVLTIPLQLRPKHSAGRKRSRHAQNNTREDGAACHYSGNPIQASCSLSACVLSPPWNQNRSSASGKGLQNFRSRCWIRHWRMRESVNEFDCSRDKLGAMRICLL